jgi:two-component system LytT family response regulator
MERVLIIDDSKCKKELNQLLLKYRKYVKADSFSSKILKDLLCISEAGQEIQKQEKRIVINAANSSILVKINDIVRCQSNRNYTELYLENGNKITVTRPLKQFAQMALFKNFARIHLSHLVNINYVDRFIKTDGGSLLLQNGTRLPVSKRRRDEWIKKLETI